MKWLVISDTHGYFSGLEQILEKEKDIKNVIFLGDGLGDIYNAKKVYPFHRFEVVPGNCDIGSGLPSMQVLTLSGFKVLICHGDGFDVKTSKLGLRRGAINLKADVVLYGHTHQQYYEYLDGLYLFCPGSVDRHISSGYAISYGIMDFTAGYPEIYNCEID